MNDWFGHSVMQPIDVDELFNSRVIISKLEFILNEDDAFYTSVVKEGNISIIC